MRPLPLPGAPLREGLVQHEVRGWPEVREDLGGLQLQADAGDREAEGGGDGAGEGQEGGVKKVRKLESIRV